MEKVLVAGVGMTRFGRQLERSLGSLAGEAVSAALADAKLAREDLDCVFAANAVAGIITGQEAVRGQVALRGLGIGGVPIFNIENACASGSSAAHLARTYLRAGSGRCVLVVGFEKMYTADKSLAFKALEACSDLEELASIRMSFGADADKRSVFMDWYANKMRAYVAKSGAPVEVLARIAAKNHNAGVANEYAQFRAAQTPESVLAARAVVMPFTLLMCSPISDGAAALVLVTESFARERGLAGPEFAASALRTESYHDGGSQIFDTACLAYAEAGISPADIDVAEVHDATAAGELFAYEDIGLAGPGEGWKLVEEGEVFPGGRVPVNPSGGLLARGHPIGASGVAKLVELTWQLRGEAGPRQVSGAKLAVAQCAGGTASFRSMTGAAAMCVNVLRA